MEQIQIVKFNVDTGLWNVDWETRVYLQFNTLWDDLKYIRRAEQQCYDEFFIRSYRWEED